MKNRRIWIIIACILIVGAAVTWYTNSYVKKEQALTSRQTEAEALPMMAEAPDILETETAGEVPENNEAGRPAGETAPAARSAEIPKNEMEASPSRALTLSPASPLEGGQDSESVLQQDDQGNYRRRLEELDRQIESLEAENAGANVYSAQTSASSELKLWEGEMNNIYSALLNQLPEQEASQLAEEQQQWLKDRDIQAADGGTTRSTSIKSVDYIASLADLTRERAYELAERYENLSQPETEAG